MNAIVLPIGVAEHMAPAVVCFLHYPRIYICVRIQSASPVDYQSHTNSARLWEGLAGIGRHAKGGPIRPPNVC